MNDVTEHRSWKEVITSDSTIWKLNWREIYEYRDLLFIWMRRDILAIYKQTILGPVWFVLQPVLTTIIYVVVFSRMINLPTTGTPPVVFYLAGIVLWSYFAECITKTATFFKDGSAIFSKVYFPRIIVPLSIVLTNLVKFGIQFLLFIVVYIYFLTTNRSLAPNNYLLLIPLLIIMIAAMGFGIGIIISSLTTRYKDFVHLINFGVQLLMFTSPVIFPISSIQGREIYRQIILANPMSGIIEAFRYGFTGNGYFSWSLLAYDGALIIVLLFAGILLFNSVERNFVDNI
jgi:lipopolysaccharide transport system permease protein